MGCSYVANTVLGLRIDHQQLEQNYTAKNTRQVRGCDHDVPENHKFCGQCGAERIVTLTPEFYFYEFQEMMQEKHPGICVESDCSEHPKYIFIGFGSEAGEGHGQCARFDMPSQEDIEALKKLLREYFIPYGVWDPRNFGIWTFLYVGC